MKKIAKLTAALLVLLICTSCGAVSNNGTPGLVTDADLIDPDATIVTAPIPDTTDDVNVNVRTDDTAYIPAQTTTPTTQAPVTTEIPKPVSNGETRITFLAAGDNIIHENVFLDAKSRASGGEKYNFIDMYEGIADAVAAADISFINQETPICGDELTVSGYPNFNTPEAAGDALIELGFDIINIANNHMLDKKEKGYKNTLDYWHERDDEVLMLGGYYDKADYENIRVYEEQGVSIAFISYTYSTNGMALPSGSTMYVPYIDKSEIVRMTKKAGELADLVFVVMHWGVENSWKPSSSQTSLAAAITEAGADVIIGMHPHVIQPVEWLRASDGSETLVIYSLGNMINTQYNNYNLVGGIMTFDIVKDASGKITIENPIYNPTVTHYNKQRLGLQLYFMEDYTAELAALHGNPSYGQSADARIWTLDKIKSFVTNNVDKEFLPEFLK